ncbi:MAG: ferredoxin [Bdellovibrionales bacterium]|jgi:ferredoxin|nr:ferredoxin [Bdellovibrionales bacterium]
MADKNAKVEQNVPGRFFVDENCIACDACIFAAQRFFAMNDDLGLAYVKKQPQNQEDIQECLEALDACPVGSIGEEDEEVTE